MDYDDSKCVQCGTPEGVREYDLSAGGGHYQLRAHLCKMHGKEAEAHMDKLREVKGP